MTRDRRAVLKLLGMAGMAAVTAPAARAAGRVRATVARDRVALMVVDPYNDFLSEEGLSWPMLRLVAEENDLVGNLQSLVAAARAGDVQIAFAPHHRYREGSFSERKYLNPGQHMQVASESFAEDRFGGQFYPGLGPEAGDIVAGEHMSSSGFAETNLHEQLAASGISHLLLAGCITNTCIEATARSGVDLGYHVTVVTDAVAAFSPAEHDFAVEVTLQLIVHRTVTTAQAVAELRGTS